LKVYLHHFSKINSHKEVTKQTESMYFLLFLPDNRRIRKAKKHMDPTHPDPQHWLQGILVAILLTAAAAQEARPRDQVGVVAKLVVRGGVGRGRGARRCFVPRRLPTGGVAATTTTQVQRFGNFCTHKKKLSSWRPVYMLISTYFLRNSL
jgi:hypothetical protein